MKYWLGFGEKLRSGGIWGGRGGLSEAILNDVGSKLACLGSCWCYVVHFGQQDGCQDGHLGDQECQDEPRWRPRGCKIELRWHPGLEIGSFYNNFVNVFDAFYVISCVSKNLQKPYVFNGFLMFWGVGWAT